MIRDTISDDMINVLLRQMGAASIKTTPAHVNIAKFEMGPDVKVTYLYEMHADEIYLQRVSPYPMMIGKLYNEQQVADIIEADLAKFRAAYESSNFPKFLETAKSVFCVNKELESLFLHHNVEGDDLEKIRRGLEELHRLIGQIGKESPKLD